MAENYVLQVTAGPSYDRSTQKVVTVNTAEPLYISSKHMNLSLNVRIQNYRGLPPSSPSTSPYFLLPTHQSANDQYSIAFHFVPRDTPISADDLVFGNDFDHPIRDRLPPGFSTAFKIVKWAIDPGLDGDVYADKPHLYGPLASSINTLRIGEKEAVAEDNSNGQGQGHNGSRKTMGSNGEGMVIEEGGEGDGGNWRRETGVPETEAARKKWFLQEENRKGWEFEVGREYWGDFYNPYLDFNEFSLRLPGFHLPIMRYWDGQGLRPNAKRSHTLRYVLKNRKTNVVYLVVLFTLYLKDDINPDGSIKEGVSGGKPLGDLTEVDHEHDHAEERKEYENAMNGERKSDGNSQTYGSRETKKQTVETSPDDVD